ncbi:hypothetical protein N7457_006263 [Penicillium paradoxum]|uniref:uncharacterized protein n=1 Tax=Penicillium paradoxum TaxID=176176 RepID=UPI002546E2DD|nr:uncharacterized protein N7457_006263 [Penicillium paradoxum]KAJ5781103.1 hypothetical protein N7457_006263 [Penicillium paradoxum]
MPTSQKSNKGIHPLSIGRVTGGSRQRGELEWGLFSQMSLMRLYRGVFFPFFQTSNHHVSTQLRCVLPKGGGKIIIPPNGVTYVPAKVKTHLLQNRDFILNPTDDHVTMP